MTTLAARSDHEISHGRKLAGGDPESTWGWGSPAGRVRALRRGRFLAADLRSGMRVLEIGAGTGLFTEMLAAYEITIVAVDISAELLELARHRGLPADRVLFLEKRFEDCDVDGPFDAIVGSSILHHLQVDQALGRIFDLLRPGGVLSFAEPNMLNPQIAVQKTVPWVKERLGDSPDETAFVRWRLARRLATIGFCDIRIAPFDWLHPATPRALIGPVSRLGLMFERMPFLREFAGSLSIRARRPPHVTKQGPEPRAA